MNIGIRFVRRQIKGVGRSSHADMRGVTEVTKKLFLASPRLLPGLLVLAVLLMALLAACDEGDTDLPVSQEVQQAAATAVAEGDRSELERLAPTAAYEATQTADQRAAAAPKSISGPTKGAAPSPISPTMTAPTTPPSVEKLTSTPGPTPIPPSDTTPETDRQALEAIYKALGGEDWKKKGNWLSNHPLHSWEGVKTNAEGRVIRLYLGLNNLTGEIPEEMFRLTDLEHLDLGANPDLTRGVPSGIGALTKLKALYLYGTGLTGPLPGEVAKLADIPDSGGDFNKIVFRVEGTGLCVPPGLEGVIVPKISYISNDDGYILGVLCEERATLVDIYEALGGEDWKKKGNWQRLRTILCIVGRG